MTTHTVLPALLPPLVAIAALALSAESIAAQSPPRPPSGPAQQAALLDREGATEKARTIWQALVDSATDAAAKAQAERSVAMSYAFDGDCAHTVKYETMVFAYWATREQAEPENAFFEEGEIADEAARVCLEAGDAAAAEQWYRKGHERGVAEPAPRKHPRSLWEYRLAHALGRIAARRGDTAEARREISEARRILDSDSALARQQAPYFPYLVGYVALYTNNLPTAHAELTNAIALRANQRDPFMHCLLAMTLEREGRQAEANAMYREAYALATGHNPPAAFVRPFVRKKLGTASLGSP
jgi:tetratricopeptide (TPR) repeat protein